ncbi:hypothetical protein DV454_002146 [Geotrichum candidum]|nr:hypothetical protein DV454_002146 [Geotrichum candidum]
MKAFTSSGSRALFARATSTSARQFASSARRALKLHQFDARNITLTELLPEQPEQEIQFRNFFLRDACTSAESVDVSTSQKNFSTARVPADIKAVAASVNPDNGALEITWSDGASSKYTQAFLRRNATLQGRRHFRHLDMHYTLWDKVPKLSAEIIHKIEYKDFIENPNSVVQALHDLGIAYIVNVPEQTGIIDNTKTGGTFGLEGTAEKPVMVEQIANRIGYVKETFYGRSWNVVSVPDAKNVAYTSVYLPLHMDLCYYESPPGVQLLHVIKNSTTGGESLFADSFAAVSHIARTDPEAYDALKEIPISYHYDNDGYHYYYSRPLVVEDPYGGIDPNTNRPYLKVVNYSPPFQGPLDAIAPGSPYSDAQVDAFVRGLRAFEDYIEEKQNQIEFKMEENCCVLFMNRRTLHARNEFDKESGERWFRGTYIDLDAYQSKLRVANNLTRH